MEACFSQGPWVETMKELIFRTLVSGLKPILTHVFYQF